MKGLTKTLTLTCVALLFGMSIATSSVQAQTYAYFSYVGLSVYDTDTKAFVTSISLGDGYTNPLGIATTPDNAYVYDVLAGTDSVKVIETASNTVVATVAVGSGPVYVAITPDGAFAYVTNRYGGTVSVIRTSDNTVVETVPVGIAPFGVAITPDGDFAYVVNSLPDNTISIIETASNTVVKTIESSDFSHPQKLAFTPDGAFAYVTNYYSNNVLVISTASNSVVGTVPVGEAPYDVAITPDGAFAYVTNYTYTPSSSGSVSVIRTSDNTVVATVPLVGQWVRDVAITPDGEFAYVAVQLGPVQVISTASNTVVYTFDTWWGGFGIAFATLQPPNQPPDCSGAAIADQSADASCGATISGADVTGVTDPDGDDLTITVSPTNLVLGANTVTVTADDGNGGTCSIDITVNVVDDTDPTLMVSPTPITLGPPNHKYHTIDISQYVTSVADSCANLSATDVVITSVSSDEEEDAQGDGDGNTTNDIVITSCNTVDLRSERQGGGNGRVYTINMEVSDGNGNSATASLQVYVPHSQNGAPAVDDGISYSVSGCGSLPKTSGKR